MDHHLVVKHPFADYSRGDVITDPEEVRAVLARSAEHVVRILPPARPAEPQPAE